MRYCTRQRVTLTSSLNTHKLVVCYGSYPNHHLFSWQSLDQTQMCVMFIEGQCLYISLLLTQFSVRGETFGDQHC